MEETTNDFGPTVIEATELRIRQVNQKIDELRSELRNLASRRAKYINSKMLESERIATRAEVYMRTLCTMP